MTDTVVLHKGFQSYLTAVLKYGLNMVLARVGMDFGWPVWVTEKPFGIGRNRSKNILFQFSYNVIWLHLYSWAKP